MFNLIFGRSLQAETILRFFDSSTLFITSSVRSALTVALMANTGRSGLHIDLNSAMRENDSRNADSVLPKQFLDAAPLKSKIELSWLLFLLGIKTQSDSGDCSCCQLNPIRDNIMTKCHKFI